MKTRSAGYLILPVLALALLAGPAPAKTQRTDADEQLYRYALSVCRFRNTNFVWVEINYARHTFVCHNDHTNHGRNNKGN